MSPLMLADQRQQVYSLRGAGMRGAWVSDMVWRREDLNGALEERQVCVCVCMSVSVHVCILYACVVVYICA